MLLHLQFFINDDAEKSLFVVWICRVAEHSSELQKEDLEKEIAAQKEENLRLREDKLQLQAQAEEDTQIKQELQEQLAQLTKHVKVDSKTKDFAAGAECVYEKAVILTCVQVIPELHKEINSLRSEKIETDRKMREQNEQTRGTV